MKVKRMGITKVLRRIWLFSTNRIKSSESIKGQLISKAIYGVVDSPKKRTKKILLDIS